MTQPADKCKFCYKEGLPIFPVRIAIARADGAHAHHAPWLDDRFCDAHGVLFNNPKPGGKPGTLLNAIPADVARYTLRPMRPGYLYVFDPRYQSKKDKGFGWSAYAILDQGYLYQFNPYKRTAPVIPKSLKKELPACVDHGHHYVARCITIPDAANAGDVWIGFSDVPWNGTVLNNHAAEAYRNAHMQKINIKDWKGVKTYAPKPIPPTPKNTGYVDMLPGWVADAFAGASGIDWKAFSMDRQTVMKSDGYVKNMVAWCDKSVGKSFHAAPMVAVPDPVGIVMELNNLAIEISNERMQEKDFEWKLETVAVIEQMEPSLKDAVTKAYPTSAANTNVYLAAIAEQSRSALSGQLYKRNAMDPNSAKSAKSMANGIWSQKYAKQLDQGALLDFYKRFSQYANDKDDKVGKLDKAYVAWFGSEAFVTSFTHNFDPKDARTGDFYQQLVNACMHDAASRRGSATFINQCLGHSILSPRSIISRSLIFNQDKIAKAVDKATSNAPMCTRISPITKLPETTIDWWEVGAKVYEAVQLTFDGKGISTADAFHNFALHIAHMGGQLSNRLGSIAGSIVVSAIRKLPERWAIGMMMGAVYVANPASKSISLELSQFTVPIQDAQNVMERIALRIAGKRVGGWIASKMPATKKVTWVSLVDKGDLGEVQNMAPLSSDQLDALAQRSIGRLLNVKTTVGIIGVIFAGMSFKATYAESRKMFQDDETLLASANFVSGSAVILGNLTETVAAGIESTRWAESAYTRTFTKPFSENVIVVKIGTVDALSTVGRFLGWVAGIAAGVYDFNQGIRNLNDSPAYGLGMMGIGIAQGAVGTLLMFEIISGPLGLVLGLGILLGTIYFSQFKNNEYQLWLKRCYFGLDHASKDGYKKIENQRDALNELGSHGA